MNKNSTILNLSFNTSTSKFKINKSSDNNIIIYCPKIKTPELLYSIVIGYASALQIINLSDNKKFEMILN